MSAIVATPATPAEADAGSALVCALQTPPRVAAGQPVQLQFSLHNTGSQPLQVLTWGTPFEPAWFARYLQVSRDGAPVPYRGASVKRGDPQAGNYLALAAGERRSATIALAAAFDASAPGRYRVQPEIVLHDVVAGTAATAPRPRAEHTAVNLACPAVEFVVER